MLSCIRRSRGFYFASLGTGREPANRLLSRLPKYPDSRIAKRCFTFIDYSSNLTMRKLAILYVLKQFSIQIKAHVTSLRYDTYRPASGKRYPRPAGDGVEIAIFVIISFEGIRASSINCKVIEMRVCSICSKNNSSCTASGEGHVYLVRKISKIRRKGKAGM